MAKMVLSAFSDEYEESFEEQLIGMRELNIDHIELRHANGKNVSTLSSDEVKTVKRQLETYGIAVSAIGSPLGKIPLDGDFNAHLEKAKRTFETAASLGAEYVRIFSFYAPHGKAIGDCKDQVIDALTPLISLAEPYGITLCHENEARIYGDTPTRCLELMETFRGALKCVYDMGNFVLEQVDPYPESYEMLRDHIAYFHIKDALSQGAIVPPGRGDAKIYQILTAHRAFARHDFFVSLEPHLETFAGRDALVGRSFENPYRYTDRRTAFTDAVIKFRELMNCENL